ncbi:MAG: hypothetical protein Q4Q06_05165 [Bacteroidota bacterium]|nr:hypothetical protein [Bacteroidota bacterium]
MKKYILIILIFCFLLSGCSSNKSVRKRRKGKCGDCPTWSKTQIKEKHHTYFC